MISAAAFGIGHLGDLGYVDTAFVILQVFVALIFGVVAGHVACAQQASWARY